MSNLSPTAVDIQSHLYSAFLEGKTSDVALRVRGTWHAVYRLHRVVLIQAGFFQSLFTAGFLESSSLRRSPKYGCDLVDIVFDDRNITRPAFEFCIARLYGGGPVLHVPSSIKPTPTHPLTPCFPTLQPPESTPPDHHLATPRFLLSLLATSIYLSIPSIASQALSLILSTIGPRTVILYLNFALGKPLPPYDPSSGEPQAAAGLENIAQALDDDDEINPISPSGAENCKTSDTFEYSDILSRLDLKDGSDPLRSPTSSNSSFSLEELASADNIVCHYGAVSNKIGEAAACWLARWASDILTYEVDQRQATPLAFRKHPKTDLDVPELYESSSRLTIWGRGGLNAKWVAALVSSDTLFVKNERHRYDFARSVVELRRQDGILPDEEQEWVSMFENGIYYANMSMEDIIAISNDISPTTQQPFVRLSVLQSAHWGQSVLRHQITQRPSSFGPQQPSSVRGKELGITVTTAEIQAKAADPKMPDEAGKSYYPIPIDSSLRIGDNGTAFNSSAESNPISMDELFKFTDSPSVAASHSSNGRTIHKSSNPQVSPLATSESTYFGLASSRQTGSSCVATDATGKGHWSPYPPCRFSVEFWDLDTLREKHRLYSNTIWYAGSLFNVYIQIVRKKGQAQLGIYLHRQSSIDPIPHPSTPLSITSPSSENPESPVGRHTDRAFSARPQSPTGTPGSPLHYSPSIHPLVHASSSLFASVNRPTSPGTSGSGSSSPPSVFSSNVHIRTGPMAPTQSYRDPRAVITAYFTISCASATGSSQTRFTSAPDTFSISQSWGWKSSSLRTEEYMIEPIEEEGGASGSESSFNNNLNTSPANRRKPRGKEVSFRATVILGLV